MLSLPYRAYNFCAADRPGFCEICDRSLFSAIFQLGCTIFDLDGGDVTNAIGAVKNAEEVAGSVIAALIDEGVLERPGEEI